MFLLLAEVLRLCAVAAARPGSAVWGFLCYHQSHAEWVGCHLHDLIQPSFSFLVGTSLAFSIAKRQDRGDSVGSMARHALIRSGVLILLGMAMRSVHPRELVLTFEDTLSQIGLGYGFLFALALCKPRAWWAAFVLVLGVHWLAFALYPVPTGFDYSAAGVSPEWLERNRLEGFGAHWQKNSNVAAMFDQWLLNAFPRSAPYVSTAGLTTLNFVPTLATMILGLAAGQRLRNASAPRVKVLWLVVAGLVALGVGAGLGATGICPVVKAVWTPSWVLFSGGWCLLGTALFYYLVDIRGYRAPVFPLVVVGMNSMTAYIMTNLYQAFSFGLIRRIVPTDSVFQALGEAYEPLVYGTAVLLLYWVVLYAMYKARWFVRI